MASVLEIETEFRFRMEFALSTGKGLEHDSDSVNSNEKIHPGNCWKYNSWSLSDLQNPCPPGKMICSQRNRGGSDHQESREMLGSGPKLGFSLERCGEL